MSAKDRRRFYMAVRKEALRAARTWDLSPQTIDAIRKATGMSCGDYTRAAIFYNDGIVRAQVLAAFMYAVALLNGRCHYDVSRDIIPEKWEAGVPSVMTLCISDVPVEGGAK